MIIETGGGPGGPTSARAGFSSVDGTRYSGTTGGRQEVVLPVDGGVVAAGDRLRYKIYPELDARLTYSATYAAVEVVFDDGSRHAGVDQYLKPADAAGQGAAKILYADQWNDVQVDLSAAAGKTAKQVLLVVNAPGAGHEFAGWIDDVEIGPAPAGPDGSDLAAYVDTRRGTNAGHDFSRGNTLPITAWPNGFNFLTPVTNASTHRWPYEYHRANNADNRPELQGLTFSHQPSPWMGDRDQLTIMPVAAAEPLGDPAERAAAFSHDDEIARPDMYLVTLANGVRAELAPTDHGAIFRFAFPADAPGRHVVVDTTDENGAFEYNGTALTGWVENGSEFGRTRMYCYGEFSTAPTSFGPAIGGRTNARAATFDVPEVTLRIATSFIGVDQARHNLSLELEGRTFEEIQAAANAAWNERLQVIRPSGATLPQLRTVYGNLYRLNLYPNSHFENAGTADAPEYRYASPVLPTSGTATARETNAVVKAGKMYVNSGFWDTYRTAWPAYAFFYPSLAAELVDGFVQQYRDGGWIARWSSPGYADCMTGTSSDVSFADAYLKGVQLPDALATYDAGLRNATVAPSETEVGRKGAATGFFAGYVSTDTEESVSWSLEAYLNDFGLAAMATRLASEVSGERRTQLLEEAEYLRRRSLNYVLLFDPAVDFFQGRRPDGSFAKSAADFDPEEWGGDFTETDGWNFAFHVVHDPRGLANLYGGPRGLEAKLDAFFSTPELAVKKGTYSIVIHEMVEAQAVRMGQFGFSNQPAHHIAWMYNYAGAPHKTQAIVREVLDRLYVGEQIGQGYPGDEDNGEMSAWYLFAALGLYPLRVGAPEYAIGSPLFPRVMVTPIGGRPLTITAAGHENPYVQGVSVDGKPLPVASIAHADLIAADQLDFTLGATPSDWASLESPPALSVGDAVARPLVDLIPTDPRNPLFDDTSATAAALGPTTTWSLPAPGAPTIYTLTSGPTEDDPASWRLEGSTDGTTWTVLDERIRQAFRWRRQTRPFTIANPGEFEHYRLTIPDSATLSQIELLA